jgi:hypothetical protein
MGEPVGEVGGAWFYVGTVTRGVIRCAVMERDINQTNRPVYRRTPTYVAPTYVDPDLSKKLLVPLPPLLPLQPPPHPPLPLPQLNTTVTPVSIINYYVFINCYYNYY